MNKKFKTTTKVFANTFTILFGVVTLGAQIAMDNASAINGAFNIPLQKVEFDPNAEIKCFYDTDYMGISDLRSASEKMVEEVMSEGLVMLKNENKALPLSSKAKVNLYSANSVNFVYTGGGSSGSNPKIVSKATSLKSGLEKSGFVVNDGLWKFYSEHQEYWQGTDFSGNQSQNKSFQTKDAKWSELPSSKNDKAEAAIMVLSRSAGENCDMFYKNNEPFTDANNYLALSNNEKDVLENLATLKKNGTIKKIIVLMNSANQIQCDFVDDEKYGIDAMIWCGTTGSTGTIAVGKALAGSINPSGGLSATFFNKHSLNPVYTNIGANEYGNSSSITNYRNGENKYYVAYQEGIYNGYKYTETRYEDVIMNRENVGEFNYDEVVKYPFGYGLSYSNFEWSDYKVTSSTENNKTTYEVSIKVTNKSKTEGKDIVQLYLQKPYTQYDMDNNVEKAAVELVGFGKTKSLKQNESDVITISVDEKYFASYDSHKAKTYVIGSNNANDNYYLTVAGDAHEATNNILKKKGYNVDGKDNLVSNPIHIDFDDVKYSTNEHIKEANASFKESYKGEAANFGVNKITNQFDDTDYLTYDNVNATATDGSTPNYMTRKNCSGTVNKKIKLTVTNDYDNDQKILEVNKDNIEYPTFNKSSGLSLIDIRNYENGDLIEYDNELWYQLLDQLSFDDYITLLSDGLRCTKLIESINAPITCEQNGSVGPIQAYGYNSTDNIFEGFAKFYEEGVGEYPTIFTCNGIVASTFNTELIERLGTQIGEECLWVGYAGMYGYGINLHRGAYNGRAFEYYSEDGFLTGMASGYETKGTQSKGVFMILKHGILNDQETNRYGISSYANEQSIRENYLLPIQVAIEVGDEAQMMGLMTGLNRLGAKWTGSQGFCNTVLRAEYGLNGIIISDFWNKYMSVENGLLNGSNLPDGTTSADALKQYSKDYGELAWAMRESVHRVLYTICRSNQMNYIAPGMKIIPVTPTWVKVLKGSQITIDIIFAISIVCLIAVWFEKPIDKLLENIKEKKKSKGNC